MVNKVEYILITHSRNIQCVASQSVMASIQACLKNCGVYRDPKDFNGVLDASANDHKRQFLSYSEPKRLAQTLQYAVEISLFQLPQESASI